MGSESEDVVSGAGAHERANADGPNVVPPEEPVADAPDRPDAGDDEPGRPSRGLRPLLAVVPVLVLVVVMWAVQLPYFVQAPGQAQEVEPLIHVSGHATYQSVGHLVLTDVDLLYRPNVFAAAAAAVRPTEQLVPTDEILEPGQTTQQYITQGFTDMSTSKIDATVVALGKVANYPKNHGDGALIESVLSGTPAAGKLYPGDLVIAANGKPVKTIADASAAIKSAGYGGTVVLTVRANEKTRTVTVSPTHLKGLDYPAIGVGMVANFPFHVDISSEGIGGPSAGLMWTLGLIDLLTPGDLTGGRIIAGTGEIATNGTVLPIGGVQQKVAAAEAAHATVFFVPVQNANDAASVAHGITIVPVRTYTDALNWLSAHPPGPAGGG